MVPSWIGWKLMNHFHQTVEIINEITEWTVNADNIHSHFFFFGDGRGKTNSERFTHGTIWMQRPYRWCIFPRETSNCGNANFFSALMDLISMFGNTHFAEKCYFHKQTTTKMRRKSHFNITMRTICVTQYCYNGWNYFSFFYKFIFFLYYNFVVFTL